MTLKSLLLLTGVLACAGASIPALAETHSSKLTCQDFIGLDEVARPKLVYWAEGFNRKGKAEDVIIDFEQNDRLVPVIVEECTKHPKHLFLSKVKAECKKHKSS